MYTHDRATTQRKYRLDHLRRLDMMVGEMVNVDIPFNNYVTGFSAFTHKAGIHAQAILNAPETYEALDPHDFGLTRYISIAHRLTGWNAVRARADQLCLALSDAHVKALTQHIKVLADERDAQLELAAGQWGRCANALCIIGIAVLLGFSDTDRLREFSYPFIAQMLMLALLWGLWFDQLVAALLYWRDRRAAA